MSVYALRDPRTGACRYVGESKNPVARLRQHARNAHSRPLRNWFDDLADAGAAATPDLEILGPGTESHWVRILSPDLNRTGGTMETPVMFVIRTTTDEVANWKRAAEAIVDQTGGVPNISALVRRAMATELKRLGVPVEKKGRR